jgi:glycosyltransferase involved in cell wall biosynthesis
MRPHVLILCEGLPYPFDVRIRAQVDAFVTDGYRVTVAGPTGQGHDALEERHEDVRIVRFPAGAGGRTPLGYVWEYATAQLHLRRLARRVHAEDPVDLILVCNPPDSLVMVTRSLRRDGAKILFDYREISPELFEAKFGRRGPMHRLLLWTERYAMRRCDAVITVSRPCAELARTRGRVDPERIFLVGNGPDARRMFPVEPRRELRRGYGRLVLWLGVMSRQEGLERLVEAADHTVNELGHDDVAFALVGPGDAHDDLRAEVARRGLGDRVLVSGAVDDDMVRAYVSTAEICVNVDERNSMNDRAGMRKVLEYMAMGKPVVQFPLQEMRRICGDTAVYARNGDAHDLALKICELLDDPARRARLGAAARERIFDGMMWHQQIPTLLRAASTALTTRAESDSASESVAAAA